MSDTARPQTVQPGRMLTRKAGPREVRRTREWPSRHLHPPMDHWTPYTELNSVLEELVTSVRSALGDAFVGAYLQGSFAVGDFDQHSDVDFIIVVKEELSDDFVAAL